MPKYRIEHALEMDTRNVLLLQQSSLDRVGDFPFGTEERPHIYMVARRPRITLDVESVEVTLETIRGKYRVQRGSSYEEVPFIGPNLYGTADLAFECEYPYTYFVVRHRQTGDVLTEIKSAIAATYAPAMAPHVALEVCTSARLTDRAARARRRCACANTRRYRRSTPTRSSSRPITTCGCCCGSSGAT